MNLIEQFPDISAKVRAKLRITQNNFKAANANYPMRYSEADALSKYYDSEFRKWHIKLFFIVVASFGALYFAILKSAWLLSLVAAQR